MELRTWILEKLAPGSQRGTSSDAELEVENLALRNRGRDVSEDILSRRVPDAGLKSMCTQPPANMQVVEDAVQVVHGPGAAQSAEASQQSLDDLPVQDLRTANPGRPMLPGDPQGLRAGASGAFRLGLRLGLFRPGCCWALMPLKFALAVAVLLWMAALAALPRQACSRFVEVVAPPPV
jgi:Predicted metal-binding integral membrane protein (DUF2182)